MKLKKISLIILNNTVIIVPWVNVLITIYETYEPVGVPEPSTSKNIKKWNNCFWPQTRKIKVSACLESMTLKSNQTRNLGVVMDPDLNFNRQIKGVSRLTGYRKTVGSDYCDSVFTCLSKKSIIQLQLVQNAAFTHILGLYNF